MNCRPEPWLRILAVGVLAVTGCHCCRRSAPAPTYAPALPPPAPSAAPPFGAPLSPPAAASQFAPVPPTSPQVPPSPTQVAPEVRYGPSASLPQQADWRGVPSRSEVRLLIDDGRSDAVALGTDRGPSPVPIAVRTWPAADAVHTLLHAGRRRLGE